MTAGPRTAELHRGTRETTIEAKLALDGSGVATIHTGLGFFDHMLTSLVRFARFDLSLRCAGDLAVDDHHTVEDVALVLGRLLDQALGQRQGIERVGWALQPMDEALARVAIDLSGRPAAVVALGFQRERIGDVATESLTHAIESLATALRAAVHVELLHGRNDHHRAEAAFKGLGLALRQAVRRLEGEEAAAVLSTKGVIE